MDRRIDPVKSSFLVRALLCLSLGMCARDRDECVRGDRVGWMGGGGVFERGSRLGKRRTSTLPAGRVLTLG